MAIDPLDHLQRKWHECFKQQQALQREVARLQGELAEADRRRDIAVQNSFEEGYRAAQEDERRARRRRSSQSA